jgi:hypothetical protein
MINASILKSDLEYYNGEGRKYLSYSDIGALLYNINQFKNPLDEDILNLMKGSYFHTYMLEDHKLPEFKLVDAGSRNAKAYKEFSEANGGRKFLLRSEALELQRLGNIMKAHPYFNGLIYGGLVGHEKASIVELFGLLFKSKADILRADYVIDLKTTGDIARFRSSARRYHYDAQAYIYSENFNRKVGFLVICKKTDTLGFYTCSDEFLRSGRNKVEKAVSNYNEYFGVNATKNIEEYFINEEL